MWVEWFILAVVAIVLGAALYWLEMEATGWVLAGGVSCFAAFVCFVLVGGEKLLPVPAVVLAAVVLAAVTVVAATVFRATDPGTSHRYPAAAAGVLLAAGLSALFAPALELAPALGAAAGGALVLALRRGDPVPLARLVVPVWTVLTVAGSVGFALEYMALLVPVVAAATPEPRAPRWLMRLFVTGQLLLALFAFGLLWATAAGTLSLPPAHWDPNPALLGAAGLAVWALGDGIVRAARSGESFLPPLRLEADTAFVCAAGFSWIGVFVGDVVLQLGFTGALLLGTAAGAAAALYARSVMSRVWIWCSGAWVLAGAAHAVLQDDDVRTAIGLLMLDVAVVLPLMPKRLANVRRD